jgi:hypothetical protein
MAKKKLPKEVSLVREYEVEKYDTKENKNISYSQYSIYSTCPHQWYLSYPKKLAPYTPSIHTVFGTALHETVQNWLDVLFNESVKASNEIDLPAYLMDRLKKTYKKERFSNGNNFTTPAQLQEFHNDGIAILDYLKKKRAIYFSTKGTYLVGVEIPLIQKLKPGLYFKAYLDLVFFNEVTGKYLILDIKTSTKGWSDYEKKSDTKISQILFYKEFFAQQFGTDVDSINVEFFIVRRKIFEGGEFVPKRVQQFRPASGKIKRGQVMSGLNRFVEEAFNNSGEYIEKDFTKNASKNNCRFCPFNKSPLCNAAIL